MTHVYADEAVTLAHEWAAEVLDKALWSPAHTQPELDPDAWEYVVALVEDLRGE